jgi:polyamine oxidase
MSTLFISAPGALNLNEINRHQNQNKIIAGIQTPAPTHPAMPSAVNATLEKLAIEKLAIEPSKKQHHVIVVGAGISGLRAASVLQRHGIAVTILEGRSDRIGGRICTSRRDGKGARDIGKLT